MGPAEGLLQAQRVGYQNVTDQQNWMTQAAQRQQMSANTQDIQAQTAQRQQQTAQLQAMMPAGSVPQVALENIVQAGVASRILTALTAAEPWLVKVSV